MTKPPLSSITQSNGPPLTDLRGRPPLTKGIRRCVNITEAEDQYLKSIGLGSRSLGLREAVRLLRHVYKHKP